MYSRGWVVLLILIVLGIFFVPYMYNRAAPGFEQVPDLEKPDEEHCVEDAQWMRAHHMQLLKEWREDVVRNSERAYHSFTFEGEEYDKNTETCFDCHESKADFCDKCHNYAGAKPNCWDCHSTPELLE